MAEKSNILPSKMGNVDPDLEAEKPSTLKKKPLVNELNVGHISRERKQWVFFVWLMTAFLPDFALKHLCRLRSPSQIQAWREKTALCIFIFISSILAIFWLEGFSLLLCPQEKSLLGPTIRHFDFGELAKETDLVAVNGRVVDLRKSTGPVSKALRPYVGLDASSMFPLFTALARIGSATGGYADPVISACVTNSSIADNWLSRRVIYDDSSMKIAGGKLVDCPKPGATFEERTSATKGETCFYNEAAFKELKSMEVGYLRYYWSIIELGAGEDWKPHYVVIDKTVYDMTWFFKLALFRLSNLDNSGTPVVVPKPQTMFMDQNVSLALGTYGNNDATPVIESFGKVKAAETVACLDRLFFAGHIQSFREKALCQVGNPILWAASAIVYALTFVKFAASFHFWRRQKMSYMDKYCVLFIPCYTEGTESLKNTINSLALTDYADDRKLLCVICDGNLTGTGNAKPTPRLVLDVLNYKGEEPDSFVYEALGDGKAKVNVAKVYVGHYTIQYHVVPFIVIAKMGKPSEQNGRPGNRGKRDSQLILMRFFSRLLKEDNLLCPLEYEIYYKIEKLLGIDPRLYEFVLMVDADTKVKADALDELIGSMLTNTDRIALCGETQVANKAKNWVTAIQVHEYYISHHIGKAFESFFGKVTCLPGCFSLYRIKYPDNRPVLVHDDIIAEYSQNKVQTLHMKNLLHLGEDRFLTTLMLKYFPKRRLEFIFSAICWTDIPDTFAILLSQRRRWINSTFHNLFELLKLPNLCGVCFLSMKMVIISDLMATIILPISTVYMYWIIGKVIYLSQTESASNEYIFVLAGLAAMYGTHVIIFIAKRQYSYIWWLLIYIILGLPIFSIVLPLYAFWHFDEFGWGTTRRIRVDKDLTGKDEASGAGDPDARVVLTRRTLKEYRRNDTRLHVSTRVNTQRSKNSDDNVSIITSESSTRGPAPTRLPASIHRVGSGTGLPHLHGVISSGPLSPSSPTDSPGPIRASALFARNSTMGPGNSSTIGSLMKPRSSFNSTVQKPAIATVNSRKTSAADEQQPQKSTRAESEGSQPRTSTLAALDELDKLATDLENI